MRNAASRSQPVGRFLAIVLLLPALLALPTLAGCAAVSGAIAVAGVIDGAMMMASPDLEPLPRAETNRETLAYPADLVFATLGRTVERNGRKLVVSTPDNYTLRVSYPFSLLANNWGGVISIQCIAQGAATTVVIMGSGRDPGARTQKIGVEILDDLKAALKLAPIEL